MFGKGLKLCQTKFMTSPMLQTTSSFLTVFLLQTAQIESESICRGEFEWSPITRRPILEFQIWRTWQKIIQMGRKHCGKGEIARYKQFLLFPQCFQKACFPGVSKGVIVWEWVKWCMMSLILYHMTTFWTRPDWKHLQNTNYLLLLWWFLSVIE